MRRFLELQGLSVLFLALFIVMPIEGVVEQQKNSSPIEFVQTLFDGIMQLYAARGQPAARIPIGNGGREIKYYRFGNMFALYEFPYNYPQPGTLESLISDPWHQGALFSFLTEKISFKSPAEGDMWVFYLANSPFMADRIGVRRFIFEDKSLRFV